MFEQQTAHLLQLPHERVSSLIHCLIHCIQNPLHQVQEAGFRAILSLSLHIRLHSASPTILPLLDTLLTETLAVLFIGGVDSENVSNACAAVHGLASILQVNPPQSKGGLMCAGKVRDLVAYGVGEV